MLTEDEQNRALREVLVSQQIEFKIQQYAAFRRLHPTIIATAKNADWADPLIHHWTIGFKAYVPVHEIASAQWPKTGWDWFKRRWFPTWAKKRWPVQYDFFKAVQLMDLGPLHRGHGATYNLAYTAGFAVSTSEKGVLPLRPVTLAIKCPSCKSMVLLRDGLRWQADHGEDK